jgi:hypothetical protein
VWIAASAARWRANRAKRPNNAVATSAPATATLATLSQPGVVRAHDREADAGIGVVAMV